MNSMESCNRVLQKLDDYHARADLMWTATLALNGLTGSGLGKVGFPMHMIEHSLSAFYNVPHGAGLSAVIPGWMRYHAAQQPDRYAQFACRVFDICEGDTLERAEKGIEALETWFQSVHSPTTITALNIPESDIPKIAKNAIALAKVWRMKNYDEAKVEAILKKCL